MSEQDRFDVKPWPKQSNQPEFPNERDEKLHSAMLQAAMWHLIGNEPSDSLMEAWRTIKGASLLELAQAAHRVASVPIKESAGGVLTIRVAMADRLVAACYVAANYEQDARPIVVLPQLGSSRAVVVANAYWTKDDGDGEGDE